MTDWTWHTLGGVASRIIANIEPANRPKEAGPKARQFREEDLAIRAARGPQRAARPREDRRRA